MQGSHSFTDKKNPGLFQDFPGSPWKIFQDLFGVCEFLNIKKKNGIYLQYSECSPLQEIQHEAKCGGQLFRIQMNLFTYGLCIHAVIVEAV